MVRASRSRSSLIHAHDNVDNDVVYDLPGVAAQLLFGGYRRATSLVTSPFIGRGHYAGAVARSTNDRVGNRRAGVRRRLIRTGGVAEEHQSQPGCHRLPPARAPRAAWRPRIRRSVVGGRCWRSGAAARAADRLLEREAASREVSLGALQVWQALTERVSGKPANREVTLVFTDLVGFSAWSLKRG